MFSGWASPAPVFPMARPCWQCLVVSKSCSSSRRLRLLLLFVFFFVPSGISECSNFASRQLKQSNSTATDVGRAKSLFPPGSIFGYLPLSLSDGIDTTRKYCMYRKTYCTDTAVPSGASQCGARLSDCGVHLISSCLSREKQTKKKKKRKRTKTDLSDPPSAVPRTDESFTYLIGFTCCPSSKLVPV